MNQPTKTFTKKNLFLIPLFVAALSLMASRVTAQVLTTLHSFTGMDGVSPQGGLVLAGNTLYGAAGNGGTETNGTVFTVNTDGSGFTVLHSFTALSNSTNCDGANPAGKLVLSGNTLYGTANGGGKWGNGTVFAINIDGSGFRVLHSFTAVSNDANNDGANPRGGLVLSGNTLYGAASRGGGFAFGNLFAISTNASDASGEGFTNLHNFPPITGYPSHFTNSDGGNPNGGLVLSGNSLYGTAYKGGENGAGTVFTVTTDGTGFETLYSFFTDYSPDGAYPSAGLVLSGNTLYGQASYGGIYGYEGSSTFNGLGTVFEVNTDSTRFAVLYRFPTNGIAIDDFSFKNSEGARPISPLIVSANTLYGTTPTGGSGGNGTVFSVNTNGTGFTVLHTFTSGSNSTNSDGASPYNAGLIIDGDILYGTTTYGGTSGGGTIFKITLPVLKLVIIPFGSNVIISWPTNFPGYALQSTTDLVPSAVWTANARGPVVVNGQNTVTNPISGTQQFFRLSQ